MTYSVGSEVRSVAADGDDDRVLIPASVIGDRIVVPTSWSHDGKVLVLRAQAGDNWDLLAYAVDSGTLSPLVATPFDEGAGRISPDGRWLAYVSLDDGQGQVYLRALTGSPARYSVGIGRAPEWIASGRELVYMSPNGATVVTVQPGDTPRIGQPVPWATPARQGDGGSNAGPASRFFAEGKYSMKGDGSRFIRIETPQAPRVTAIDLVTHWTGGPVAGR